MGNAEVEVLRSAIVQAVSLISESASEMSSFFSMQGKETGGGN